MELCVDMTTILNGLQNVVQVNGALARQTWQMLFLDQVSYAKKVSAISLHIVQDFATYLIHQVALRLNITMHLFLLAITNCGGSQLAPGCSYCPMSDDVFFNTWCSGNCEFDETEGTCTEIKGKSKRFSFLAYLIKIILDHKRQYSSQHHFNLH